ncbi:MAG: formylglycine-generating enzyme family protein, partial [Planctomycetales bacterium]|nr:formylglycine-generating enzyme family protein [Planctomycetales bacterium]
MHRWMVTVFFLLLALQGCFRSKTTPSLSLSESQALQENAASNLNTPVEITNSLGIRLRLIPPGEFTMGSPNSERGRRAVERQHRVRITTPFYMATTEVTQAQWLELMDDNPSFIEGDDHPVETIPWSEAVEFCRRLSEKEGKRYRLPTEAE